MELLITIIVLALIFDYINGFHDAANAIATIVSTKVLTPLQAVIWAAFFNFLAFFIAKYLIGDFGIANTVSKTVYEQYITLPVILSGVIAAIIWNLWTWWRGIPSSSSHTLIGGFAGAAIAAYGFGAIQSSVILKIVLFIFLAPVIGMLVAFLFTLIVLNLCRKAHPHTAEKWFKRLQLLSSALFSIGHGLNDSQKVMGIIAAALIAAHSQGIGMGVNNVGDLPDWVAFSCFTAISLGTMSGGWKIVRTMGNRITRVTPLEGVIAETAGAFTLYFTEYLKIPVSTTHTISGAIIGVGATRRLSAVRWGVTRSLMTAWVLTIPVSAALAAAIVSSLASMLNSTSTIFTMDIYKPYFNPQASQQRLVNVGRLSAGIALVIAILMAPLLGGIDQMFQYIQEYTGLVSPGILAVFLMGLFWKKATNKGAIWGVLCSIPIALLFKFLPLEMHFMDQMFYTCIITIVIIFMVSLTSCKTDDDPKAIVLTSDMFKTDKIFNICAYIICILLVVIYTVLL